MSNHRKTWQLWLEKISPLKWDNGAAMAEALSIASPHGPQGFACIDDDCEFHRLEAAKKTRHSSLGRWRLHVKDESGRARLVFSDGPDIIGVMMMSWQDYRALSTIITNFILKVAKETNVRTLNDRLFRDAIIRFDNSPELAQIKLLEFGWNMQMIDSYSEELARSLVKAVIDQMPEHV